MRAFFAAVLLLGGVLAVALPSSASTYLPPCMGAPDSAATGACAHCVVDAQTGAYDCIVQACIAGIYTDYTAYEHPDNATGEYGGASGYYDQITCPGPLADPYAGFWGAVQDPIAAALGVVCPISVEVGGSGAVCYG